jgi:TMEM175 potassium channel family protein
MMTSRLETFSDGVFAIAATLLVLDLRVPAVGSGALWPQLLAQWPSYFGYLVSFLTIGIIWVNHHALFALIERVDRPILFLNLLLLLVVSLIPFPTALLGEWVVDQQQGAVAAAILGCVYLLMGLSFGGIWLYAILRHELAGPGFNRSGARASIPRFTIGNAAYLLGIGLAFLSPVISLAVYLLVAVYYVFPTLPRPHSNQQDSDRD